MQIKIEWIVCFLRYCPYDTNKDSQAVVHSRQYPNSAETPQKRHQSPDSKPDVQVMSQSLLTPFLHWYNFEILSVMKTSLQFGERKAIHLGTILHVPGHFCNADAFTVRQQGSWRQDTNRQDNVSQAPQNPIFYRNSYKHNSQSNGFTICNNKKVPHYYYKPTFGFHLL